MVYFTPRRPLEDPGSCGELFVENHPSPPVHLFSSLPYSWPSFFNVRDVLPGVSVRSRVFALRPLSLSRLPELGR